MQSSTYIPFKCQKSYTENLSAKKSENWKIQWNESSFVLKKVSLIWVELHAKSVSLLEEAARRLWISLLLEL